MKKFAIAAVAALVAASAFAAAGWVGAGVINVNGTWYYADQHETTGWASGPFDGAQLEGYALNLAGQVQLWDSDSAEWGEGSKAIMAYRIDGGDFVEADLIKYKFENNNNYFQSGGADFATFSIAEAADWAAGSTHTIDVYFVDVDKTQYDSNGGNNFSATFTKTIPEPATMSLLGLGALAMVLRRKLSK